MNRWLPRVGVLVCVWSLGAACLGVDEPPGWDGGQNQQPYRYADFGAAFVPGPDAPDPGADPALLEGPPDGLGVTPGNAGIVIVGFGLKTQPPGFILDNAQRDDLLIHIVGDAAFSASVEVSTDGALYRYVGNINEHLVTADIARAGFATASFVRVVVMSGGTQIQIDAFEALQ